ncbi:MAG: biopolymer transporter ExbD [Burkholderiaceae bacterium]
MPSLSSRGGRGRRMVNEINVVPYIDVMLVLLVIFMVTAPLLSPGVIDLPTVGSSRVKKDVYVELQIPRNGAMVLLLKNSDQNVGEVPVEPADLVASVRTLTNGDPSVPVVISADKIVLYEQVMNAMNELKSAGMRKVGLLVKKPN